MRQNYLIIPINIYEGRIEIRGEAKLHPIHTLILELAVTEHNLEKVVNSFGLDRRLVQEAIVDLMYKDLIYLDLAHSLIFVSPIIEDYIDRGRLDTYLGTEYPETVSVKWVQDTVTGQIMMTNEIYSYFRKPFHLSEEYISSKDRLQLKRRDYIKIQELSPQTLVKAAKMTLRSFISEGDVLDRVNRIKKLDMVDNRLIYIPLKKRAFHGVDYEIPVASTIPSNVLESWTKSLTEIDAYSISDLTPIDEDFLAQYDWKTLMRRWNSIIYKISRLFNKGLDKRTIKRFAQEAARSLEYEGLNSIIPLMHELNASVETIDIAILRGRALLIRLEKSLDEAEKLIIIGSAFISEVGLDHLTSLLEKYANKEIKVILLWGLLGQPIEEINRKYPILTHSNVKLISCEEKFHSKFVIIDARSAWITSCNLLSYWYGEDSPAEIICELRGGRIITELIEYIRSKLLRQKEQLIWIDNIGSLEEIKSDVILRQELQLNEFKEIIKELNEKCQALIGKSSDSAVFNGLQLSFDQMNKNLRGLRMTTTAVLVKNLEHRKILRAGLLHSQQAVQIGTDRILKPALGPVVIAALNVALKNGIPVQVRWGKDNPQHTNKDVLSPYRNTLAYLHSETEQKIEISNLPSHSHAKFLTVDDHLSVVTSYNLFAFAGDGLADDEITEELGVVLTSQEATKNISSTFPPPRKLPKLSKKSVKTKKHRKKKR